MKAVSLHQPFATLIALGAKRNETRTWPPPAQWRGVRIAIHAALTEAQLWRCTIEPYVRHVSHPGTLPFGAVVCTAVVADWVQVTDANAERLRDAHPEEFEFGDYREGRWAWALRDVEVLEEPVPFKGRQRIFDVPDHLLGRIPAQGTLL